MVQVHCLHSGNVGWLSLKQFFLYFSYFLPPFVSILWIFLLNIMVNTDQTKESKENHIWKTMSLVLTRTYRHWMEQRKVGCTPTSQGLPTFLPKAIWVGIQKRMVSTDKPGFKSWHRHRLVVWPMASYVSPLSLSFFIYMVGKVIAIFQHCHEVENNSVQLNCLDI